MCECVWTFYSCFLIYKLEYFLEMDRDVQDCTSIGSFGPIMVNPFVLCLKLVTIFSFEEEYVYGLIVRSEQFQSTCCREEAFFSHSLGIMVKDIVCQSQKGVQFVIQCSSRSQDKSLSLVQPYILYLPCVKTNSLLLEYFICDVTILHCYVGVDLHIIFK